MRNEGLMPYEVMQRSAPPDHLANIEGGVCELPPGYPVYYFVYGTFNSSGNSPTYIDAPEEPQMRKAKLVRYSFIK